MTRKDFNAIAEALALASTPGMTKSEINTRSRCCVEVARLFAAQSVTFKADKFLDACKVKVR